MIFLSREYRGRKIVIYPQYLDSSKTRSEGRKISLKHAIPHPKVEEIIKASEKLGLEPFVEDKKYCREWWVYTQRIIINKKDSKLKTLREISLKIKEMRYQK